MNMLSPGQVMNTSFNPLEIVNTYGAFGSVSKERNEIILEGTDADNPTEATAWRAYEFRGKPGDPTRMAPQIAPYHLRLDWLMWFAAMSSPSDYPWFPELLLELLEGDAAASSLLRINPFPGVRLCGSGPSSIATGSPRPRSAPGQARGGTGSAGRTFPAVRLQAGAAPAR